MNLLLAARGRKWLCIFLLAIPAAIWLVQELTDAATKNEVKKMTQEINAIKMQTVCIGRFLIDVPADAQISYRRAFLAGWTISSNSEETDIAFTERLGATEAELKLAKNARGGAKLEFAKYIESDGAFGKILVHSRQWTYGIENGKRVDSTFVDVDASVRMQGVSFDFAMKFGDEGEVDELTRVISQLKPRAADFVPQDPGFCFDEGILTDPLEASQNERVAVFIGLKGHPDVAIAANTMAGLQPQESLLERDARSSVKQSNPSNFKSIRKGVRPIAGMPGEEMLQIVVEPNGTKSQDFMWESPGEKENVFRPNFILEMNTGHGQPGSPVNSSLTDAKALALWDRISSSLRVRPTRNSTAKARSGGTAALGTLALASDKCPQSGWWECTDGSERVDIVDGRRQYFTEGQIFPQAVLITPGTVWQNFRGDRPTFTSSVPSTWKLTDRRKVKRSAAASILAKSFPAPEDSAAAVADAHRIDEVATGTEVTSAMACPASGWWECSEAKAFDGTRWFARGGLLPPATISAAIGLIEKMKGAPEFVRVSASWRLLRLAKASPSSASLEPAADDSEQAPAPVADNSPNSPTKDA